MLTFPSKSSTDSQHHFTKENTMSFPNPLFYLVPIILFLTIVAALYCSFRPKLIKYLQQKKIRRTTEAKLKQIEKYRRERHLVYLTRAENAQYE